MKQKKEKEKKPTQLHSPSLIHSSLPSPLLKSAPFPETKSERGGVGRTNLYTSIPSVQTPRPIKRPINQIDPVPIRVLEENRFAKLLVSRFLLQELNAARLQAAISLIEIIHFEEQEARIPRLVSYRFLLAPGGGTDDAESDHWHHLCEFWRGEDYEALSLFGVAVDFAVFVDGEV